MNDITLYRLLLLFLLHNASLTPGALSKTSKTETSTEGKKKNRKDVGRESKKKQNPAEVLHEKKTEKENESAVVCRCDHSCRFRFSTMHTSRHHRLRRSIEWQQRRHEDTRDSPRRQERGATTARCGCRHRRCSDFSLLFLFENLFNLLLCVYGVRLCCRALDGTAARLR